MPETRHSRTLGVSLMNTPTLLNFKRNQNSSTVRDLRNHPSPVGKQSREQSQSWHWNQVSSLLRPWTPRTVACQALLSMEFFRQEYRSWLPFSTPGDLPRPGIKPTSLASPALAGGFFTTATWGEGHITKYKYGMSPLTTYCWNEFYFHFQGLLKIMYLKTNRMIHCQ